MKNNVFNFTAIFRDSFDFQGLEKVDYKPPSKTVKRFINIFDRISDKRMASMIEYQLREILLIAFFAVLSGAANWGEIESFGQHKKKWISKFLNLKNGIPSHDTFRRVFALIDPIELERATVLFLLENIDIIKKSLNLKVDKPSLICVDGKEQKGTGRKYGTDEKVANLQTLHIYDASNEICICSRAIDSKSNEIPVAQENLKALQLNDCIVSFDAMHTQKETIKIIAEKKGDYVGALKGNQGTLENDAKALFSEKAMESIKLEKINYLVTKEKAHSQIEIREFFMIKAKATFTGKEGWKKLRNFICYKKTVKKLDTDKTSIETRYYITSLTDVDLAAEAIRGHWSIENKLHWHLDYSFYEDDNATMDKNAFNNLSILNKLALSIYKLVKTLTKNDSIRVIRKCFGWGTEDMLCKVLGTFDEDILKSALENAINRSK